MYGLTISSFHTNILFETKGFDNTSTSDILNEIGIARGTLYYHFKSKEEIPDAMIIRMTKRLAGMPDGKETCRRSPAS